MIRKHGLTKGGGSRQVNVARMEQVVQEAVKHVHLAMNDGPIEH